MKCIQHTIQENLLLLDLQHIIATSIDAFFHILDDIVDKYIVHRTIKMNPIDVTSDSYAEYNEDPNKKDPRFKIGDRVRISK